MLLLPLATVVVVVGALAAAVVVVCSAGRGPPIGRAKAIRL